MKPTNVLAIATDGSDDSELEAMLLDLVNAQVSETRDDTGRIFSRYSQFLPRPPSTFDEQVDLMPLLGTGWARMLAELPEGPLVYQRGIVKRIAERLQDIWNEKDPESSQWQLSGFQCLMNALTTGRAYSDPPPDTPFFRALALLWRSLGTLKKCANPACPNPFFIAVRKERRCCELPKCVAVVRGASVHQRWWAKLHEPDESRQPELTPTSTEGGPANRGFQAGQVTIADSAMRAFIVDVANAGNKKIAGRELYFFTHYREFFPTKDEDMDFWSLCPGRNCYKAPDEIDSRLPYEYHWTVIRSLRDRLRDVWRAKENNKLEAKLRVFRARVAMHGLTYTRGRSNWRLQPPSPHAPIYQALRWVQQNFPKLKTCKNSRCRRRFFVAAGKGSYCSPDCRRIGFNESKMRWWNKQGSKERRNQSKRDDGHN